jgi:SAM-dependent methyltransferase
LNPLKILNLGCGVKTSSAPEVINVDWSIYLRLRRNRLGRQLALSLLSGERLERFKGMPSNIVVHNLSKGIPFDTASVDAVYHSHMLEHLARDVAPKFLLEVKRVLKPGGIQRIVVPDLQLLCRQYLSHLETCERASQESAKHDSYVSALIEQCVRKEGTGSTLQPPLRRMVENVLRGDARRRGETHQWMYDRVNLGFVLTELGYKNPRQQDYRTSLIPNWNEFGLDIDAQGNEYKPGSLYLEVQT